MFTAYIGLGANLGDPPQQLQRALTLLATVCEVQAVSPVYRSAPMGPADQPDYANAVCVLKTARAPEDLMRALLGIEQQMGRVRALHWGPRLIDLDLLHVDGQRCQSALLTLPHPGIAQRNFVLQPLLDLAPNLLIEGVGDLRAALARVGTAGLQRWDDQGARASSPDSITWPT
ncbi:2-amino-4-hydroxy-6-hydroxymethyldihydropteridine diphosphokinase [Sinimarinibacterium sp. NLF-5-8]|uniref:2-amino-4-hydroxy-6- hydroxymethyldihydropteridine diphosphokinase n=1 Tax=Sinimarinibacterium sp. NLF-5-8 TaxID=2698684 RepID=UPI00137C287D|nr:2-amino-4-hydroxy-6-hydroxymethyldihydropteridine diphosphokinase [Sinimarinibacterium sp. NLF-5-8]QHS08696.1 2-amino-4-hydroxy-6-hydroxymethyldihydropteridine diphosphokinase [Sinimarinibacterium sp. NLF-5-8]